MGGFDFSSVLAAATKVPRAAEDGTWRCVVYLSAFDWLNGWRCESDLAAQSAECKAHLAMHAGLKKVETIRNRNTVRNYHVAFNELMDVIENRRADCVVVPDIAVFATCQSEARFYVEEVLVPMGFRFIDCSRGFDSAVDDVRAYLKGVQDESTEVHALRNECERLASGRVIRRNVPYGYVFDESVDSGVRIDEEVAGFVPRIFELAARERWWKSEIESKVWELGCPGVRERFNALYGLSLPDRGSWDSVAIRNMVTNPFYLGDFQPSALASKRFAKSDISVDSFDVIHGHHPALVSRELFDAANAGLKRNYCACPSEAEGRRPING